MSTADVGDDLACPSALGCNNEQVLGIAILAAVCFFGVAARRYRCECRQRGLRLLGAGECKILWTMFGFVCGCLVEFWVIFQVARVRDHRFTDWLARYTELENLWWWGVTILVFVAVGHIRIQGSREVQQPLDLHNEVWMMIHVFWIVVSLTFSGGSIYQLMVRSYVDRTTTVVFGYWCAATAIAIVVYCFATSRACGGAPTLTVETCGINEAASMAAGRESNIPLTPKGALMLNALYLDGHAHALEEMGLLDRLNEVSLSELQRAGLPLLHARALLSAASGTGAEMDTEEQRIT
jgi:hypothetical protein